MSLKDHIIRNVRSPKDDTRLVKHADRKTTIYTIDTITVTN